MTVAIVDYGMGNLGSVHRALEDCGASPVITHDPLTVKNADHIILPGVGAFAEGMSRLNDLHLVEALKLAAIQGETPLLGICLGMQLLASSGVEGGKTAGLGMIPGRVERLVPRSEDERIPHIGWNEVRWKPNVPIYANFQDVRDFYFVHSYHFIPDSPVYVAAATPYCGEFISAVCAGNVFGVQFHPEKSSKNGLQLLKSFLSLSRPLEKKNLC